MTADLPPLLLALLLLAAVCVAQQATVDHEVRLNADQCNAMGRAVAASQLPSSPCFDKTGGQLGINQRSVRHAHPLRVKTAKNKQNGVFDDPLLAQDATRVVVCRFKSACVNLVATPPPPAGVLPLAEPFAAELNATRCPTRPFQDTSFCGHLKSTGDALCQPSACQRALPGVSATTSF
jgi:hypothetical protein